MHFVIIGFDISKKLRLNRQLTEFEESYVKKWIIDYEYDLEIITLALKQTTSKSNFNFNFLDKILTDWHDRNLKTPSEIEKFLTNSKQKSKNISNLKKKTSYQNYEQRNYDNLDSLYANKF